MTIAAKYEDGVFKPLEDVKLAEGTRVEVHVPRGRTKAAQVRPRSADLWQCGPTVTTSLTA